MVWLHALQRVTEHAAAVDFDFTLLGDNGSFNLGSRPKVMMHRAPRRLGICAVVRCAILATHESWSNPGELDVYQAAVVHRSLDCVKASVFGQFD